MTAALHLIAGLALFGAVQAASQRPAPTPGRDGHKQQADAEHTATTPQQERGGSQDTPLFVKVVPTPPSQEQLTREANERQEKASSDGKLVTWTAVLAWATLVLMFFTGINLLMLRGQKDELREQRGLMQKQADHLEEQAVQLRASVAQMRDTAERQLRAYVCRAGNPNVRESHPVIGQTVFEFFVPIKNMGATPASRMLARGKSVVSATSMPPDALDLPPDFGISQVALGPGQLVKVSCASEALTDSQVSDVKVPPPLRAWTLFLIGEITYQDAFGRAQHLRFCEGIEWRGDTTVGYMAPGPNEAS